MKLARAALGGSQSESSQLLLAVFVLSAGFLLLCNVTDVTHSENKVSVTERPNLLPTRRRVYL